MGKQRTDIAKITKTCEKAFFLIAQLGSNWNNGTNAGSFYWNCNNSVSNRNRNISGQLLNALNKKPTIHCDSVCPATWQNIKINF